MFNSLQICRGVAALLVVLFHIGGVLAKEKYFGQYADPWQDLFFFGGPAGVAFFFVLSGFIISHAHHKDFGKPDKLVQYGFKRLIRIYPTYIIIFSAIYLLAILTPSLRNTVPHDPLILIKSLALIPQDPAVVGKTGAPVLDAAWTLQYEMIFYLAVAALILNRWLFLAILLTFFANFIESNISGSKQFPQYFFANELIMLFGMGMISSILSLKIVEIKRPALISSLAFGLFLMIGLANTNGFTHLSKAELNLTYGVLSSIVILAIVHDERLHPSRYEQRPLIMLGNSSYALYLLNFPIISLVVKVAIALGATGYSGAFLSLAFCLAVCISVSFWFNIFVEKPIMKRLTFLTSTSK